MKPLESPLLYWVGIFWILMAWFSRAVADNNRLVRYFRSITSSRKFSFIGRESVFQHGCSSRPSSLITKYDEYLSKCEMLQGRYAVNTIFNLHIGCLRVWVCTHICNHVIRTGRGSDTECHKTMWYDPMRYRQHSQAVGRASDAMFYHRGNHPERNKGGGGTCSFMQ